MKTLNFVKFISIVTRLFMYAQHVYNHCIGIRSCLLCILFSTFKPLWSLFFLDCRSSAAYIWPITKPTVQHEVCLCVADYCSWRRSCQTADTVCTCSSATRMITSNTNATQLVTFALPTTATVLQTTYLVTIAPMSPAARTLESIGTQSYTTKDR